MMLQQTQVHRVIPKWLAFLERFPTPAECALAPLSEVLVLWQGLGYPRRARNLHLLAAIVEEQHDGVFPSDLTRLLALPGIGNYTARALRAFAFELDAAVVDTNAARVLARWNGARLTPKQVQEAADAALAPGESWSWNQAMLDLGATVCKPSAPLCAECPVSRWCGWRGAAEQPDPAVGSAGVSGRQARFEGSDRQLRGQLLRALTNGSLPVEQWIGTDATATIRRRTVIDGLVTDGLIVERDGRLLLPS
jgi:A/G-specific adenine glycosylase